MGFRAFVLTWSAKQSASQAQPSRDRDSAMTTMTASWITSSRLHGWLGIEFIICLILNLTWIYWKAGHHPSHSQKPSHLCWRGVFSAAVSHCHSDVEVVVMWCRTLYRDVNLSHLLIKIPIFSFHSIRLVLAYVSASTLHFSERPFNQLQNISQLLLRGLSHFSSRSEFELSADVGIGTNQIERTANNNN